MASKAIYTVVAVVGIAAASAFAWWYQSRPHVPTEITGQGARAAAEPTGARAPGGAARPAGVEVARVERTALQDDAQSVGSLRSRQSVMLRPEVAGRVKALGFVDGAAVRAGQVLVQLDDTLQRAEIKQAAAQVSIANANFKRNQELVAQSFVAQRVLEESSANLQVAQAQLALACARLSRMAITAPFDGTVGIRNVNLGDYVKDGADLVNLEDLRSMYVDFRLPERYQGKLRLRQTAELRLDSMPGRVFNASIVAIDPLLDVNGRSVAVRAVLANTSGESAPIPAARGTGGGGRAGAGGGAGPGGGTGAADRSGTVAGAGTAGRTGAPAASSGRPAGVRPPGAAMSQRVRAAGGADGAGTSGGGSGAAVSKADADGCAPSNDASAANAGAASAGRNKSVEAEMPRIARGASPGPLRPGMFARVTTLFAVKESALVIPEEAIVPQGGRQFVVKVVEPSALPAASGAVPSPDVKLVSLRQEVRLGARQLGKVEVVEGLAEGEMVVVAGQQRLQRDGTALRVVDLSRLGQGGESGRAPQKAASAPNPAPSP